MTYDVIVSFDMTDLIDQLSLIAKVINEIMEAKFLEINGKMMNCLRNFINHFGDLVVRSAKNMRIYDIPENYKCESGYFPEFSTGYTGITTISEFKKIF